MAQDMDFFGEVTPEEQAAADEKNRIIAEAKARGAAKAKLSKSMIIMDVKPWDDTTGKPSFSCHPWLTIPCDIERLLLVKCCCNVCILWTSDRCANYTACSLCR